MDDAMVPRYESCTTCERLVAPLPSPRARALARWIRKAETAPGLEEALGTATARLVPLADADRSSVLVPIGHNGLRILASSEPGEHGDIIISLDLYPELAHLLCSQEPLLVSDVATEELLRPVRHLLHNAGTISIAAAPFHHAEVKAVLRMVSRSRRFTPRDLHLLRAAAHLIEHLVASFDTPLAEEVLLKELALQMGDGLLDLSLDGRIIAVEGPLEQRLGLKPELLIDKFMDEVFTDLWSEEARRPLRDIIEGKPSRDGVISGVTLADHEHLRVQLWGVRAGGVRTAARFAVRRIDEMHARVTSVLNQVPIPIIEIDHTNNLVVSVNRATERLAGVAASQLVGRSLSELVNERDEHAVLSLTTGAEIPVRLCRSRRCKGEPTTQLALVDLRPFAPAPQREAHMRATLKRQIDELEELRRRFDDLEAIRTRFLSSSAHELKTPLTVIQSYLEIFIEDLSDGLTEQQLSFLRITYESVLRLRRLVIDLVDLAALEGGNIQLDIGPVAVADAVCVVTEEMQPLARRAGITLSLGKLAHLPCARADSHRVHQVLRNLVDNAIKNTPQQGRVHITGHTDGDSVVLEVHDTGVGIPADQLALVFDQFTQLEPRRDHRRQGSGLGLAISRRIMQTLGGRISVRSTHGEGSVFTISLPQWPEELASS